MALLSTAIPDLRLPEFGLRRLFKAMGRVLIAIGNSNAKVRRANALMAMTDAELAARGLKRGDIARHVFADTYWV